MAEVSDLDEIVYGITVYEGLFRYCRSYVPVGIPSPDDKTYFCETYTHVPYEAIITEWLNKGKRRKYEISTYRIRVERGNGVKNVNKGRYGHGDSSFKKSYNLTVGSVKTTVSTKTLLGQKIFVTKRIGRIRSNVGSVDDSETERV